MIPVILSGGSGTRLWPLSRKMFPKQFLSLAGEQSMLQETISRLNGLELMPPIVVCNEDHRFIVAEQLKQLEITGSQIILEPIGRNTAPAVAVSALLSIKNDPEALILILAADHVIDNKIEFHKAIEKAKYHARRGKLVTFGIVPVGPETGYGYIQRGNSLDNGGFQVGQFVEKPDLATAEKYLNSGDFYWNSGMFLFNASRYLEELGKFRPDILEICQQAVSEVSIDYDFQRLGGDTFRMCPSESVDYAVMEKTNAAVVLPLDAGWNDIGSWSALWEINEKDTNGNALKGDVLIQQTKNCLIHTEERLVATVGVENLIVIETKDAVLVADRSKSQEVKKIVEQLQEQERDEELFHRVVYRPWGCFDSIEQGERFKVKRITVKPGAKLSVQMHHHRAEHWIVVSGTAKVTRGKETIYLAENESTYIHVEQVHSLENPGRIPLELIEVQSGSYLGEDDIVRFEDRYGREGKS